MLTSLHPRPDSELGKHGKGVDIGDQSLVLSLNSCDQQASWTRDSCATQRIYSQYMGFGYTLASVDTVDSTIV